MRNLIPVLCLGICTTFLSLTNATAQLGFTFTSNRQEVTTKPADKLVTVPYFFENKTKRTLTISRYSSACSCVDARVRGKKLEYKPGEKGEIHVDFKLGTFSGKVEKTLLLWTTDDPEEKPSSVLTVALNIPVLIEMKPKNKTLYWDQNGAVEPKTIKIKINYASPIHITEHSGTSKNFAYELKTIKHGWEYELVVTPKDVSQLGMGMIRFRTDSPIPRFQRQMAFVCVRKATQATKK